MGVLISTIVAIMVLTYSLYRFHNDLWDSSCTASSKTLSFLIIVGVSILMTFFAFISCFSIFLLVDEPAQAQETLISTHELNRIIYDDKRAKYVCFDSNGEVTHELDDMERREIKLIHTEDDTQNIIVETWTGKSETLGVEETSYTIYMPQNKAIEYSLEEVSYE